MHLFKRAIVKEELCSTSSHANAVKMKEVKERDRCYGMACAMEGINCSDVEEEVD